VAKKSPITTVKPTPATQARKTAIAAQIPKPAAAAASNKAISGEVKPLPYTIQISSFRDPQQSFQVARKLNTNGDPAFTSPVDISGKGKWHRVYIGNYKTRAEAEAVAADLKRRKFRYVNISKKPYTVQIGAAVSRSEARILESRLQERGYFNYSLPAKTDPNRIRILIGAFENKTAATALVQQLTADGFSPTIELK
jgi:cell division septation protein DedD